MGLFRYLLCCCCESGHVLVWRIDAHQCVHCLDRNNNYCRCLWHEHSLSNVHRWAFDCIAEDMQENKLTMALKAALWLLCPSEMWWIVLFMPHFSLSTSLPSCFPASFLHFHDQCFLSSDGCGSVSEEKTTF